MKEELKINQNNAMDFVRNILRDIDQNLINHDLEHSISFSQKYPVALYYLAHTMNLKNICIYIQLAIHIMRFI